MTAHKPGHFLENLVGFGRLLRSLGLSTQAAGPRDMAAAIDWIDLADREQFFLTARSLYTMRSQDWPAFKMAFELFWSSDLQRSASGARQKQVLSRVSEASIGSEQTRGTRYSPTEYLRNADFAELTDEELEAVGRLILGLEWRLGSGRSRRWTATRRRAIDMRRTLRDSMRHEGEVLRLLERGNQERPRPLTVLADVSGSMEPYARLLLLFVSGLAKGLDQPVEGFVFGTQLTRVTRSLGFHHLQDTLDDISEAVPDWSGGTRIGAALKQFNFEWSRRVLGRAT